MPGFSLLSVLFSTVAGILTFRFFQPPFWVALVPLSVASFFLGAKVWIARFKPFVIPSGINEATACTLFYTIGLFSACIQSPTVTEFPKGRYYVSGTVCDYTPNDKGDAVEIAVSSLRLPDGTVEKPRNLKILLNVTDATNLSFGSQLRGEALLRPTGTPGNYLDSDHTTFLLNRNILLVGTSVPSTVKISEGKLTPDAYFRNLRYDIEEFIENSPLQPGCRDFIISMLLGDKTYIKGEERLVFSDAGISHIFAVSGFHVSLIGGFIIAILSPFFMGSQRRWKFLVSIPFIWFYVLLAGASPATCRAGIMLSIGLTALFLQRKNNALRALGWATLIILVLNPPSLFDVGFQLSVVCVGTLLLFTGPLNFIDHRSHPFLHRLVSIVLVALTASLSVWMITAFYFHRFSLMFLPMNIIAVPMIPLFVALVLTYLLLLWGGISLQPFTVVIDRFYELFMNSAAYLSARSSAVENLNPHILSVILWTSGVALLGFFIYRKRGFKWLSLPVSMLVISLVSLPFMADTGHPTGFIIQRNSKSATVICYDGGKEYLHTIPEAKVSVSEILGKKILTVNSADLQSDISPFVADADIILFGGKCREIPREIIGSLKDKTIMVSHPSLHWRYERSLLEDASALGLKVHSLRYDGPLHVFG